MRMEGPSPAVEWRGTRPARRIDRAGSGNGRRHFLGHGRGRRSPMPKEAIVVVNFLLAAWSLGFAARISIALMAGVALFGFLIRLGLITLAVLLVRDAAWVELIPPGSRSSSLISDCCSGRCVSCPPR